MHKKIKQNVKRENISFEKGKISISTFFFGMFILFAFACYNKYFSVTEYFYFPVLSILFCLLHFFYKDKIIFRVEQLCCIFILGILMMYLVVYWGEMERGFHFSYILLVLLFLMITLKRMNREELRFTINCYILSALIISLMIIILRQEFEGWVGTYRYTVKSLNQVYIDPNFLAAFINIPGIICVNRLLVTGQKKYILVIFIILLGVFLTGSRAALVAFFIGSVAVIGCHRKKIFWIILFLPVLGIILLKVLPFDTIQRMFINSYMDDSNLTRLLNWQMGWTAFQRSPLLGYGTKSTSQILYNSFIYERAAHNTFITGLLHFGLIGWVPFLIILLKIVLITLKKGMRILFGISLSILFTSIMIEANVSITLWVVLILLYQIYYFKKYHPEVNLAEVI